MELTTKDKEQIIELFKKGMPIEDISKQFNKTYIIIDGILVENGLKVHKFRNLTDAQVENVKRLYIEGFGMKTISRDTGISYSTVNSIIHTAGIDINKTWRNRALTVNKKLSNPLSVKKLPTVPENEKCINCDKQGARCIYRSKSTSLFKCDYYAKTGVLRGGTPDECSKYCFRRNKKIS